MYTGFGALSTDQAAALQRVLPSCYGEAFDRCVKDKNRFLPECRQYEPVHAAYDKDFKQTDDIIEAMRYCSYDVKYLAIAGGAGLFAGALLVLALRA